MTVMLDMSAAPGLFKRVDADVKRAIQKGLRSAARLSQAVLAHHLNVGTKLISDWERGVKRPSGPSLKLLALARAKGLDRIA